MGYLDMPQPPAPTPKGTEVPVSQQPRRGSKGKGRCLANPYINGAPARVRGARHESTIPGLGAQQLQLSPKELRALEKKLEAEGLEWDHMVETTLPDGRVVTHYVDSSTLAGGLPRNCPPELRSMIRTFTTSMSESSLAPLSDPKDLTMYQARLALRLREMGYPTDADSLVAAHQGLFPLPSLPQFREASELELHSISQMHRNDPVRALQVRAALESGLRFAVTTDVNGSIVTAVAGGQVLYDASGDLDLAAAAAKESFAQVESGRRCHGCSSATEICSCDDQFVAALTLEEGLARHLDYHERPRSQDPSRRSWHGGWRKDPVVSGVVRSEEVERAAARLAELAPSSWAALSESDAAHIQFDVAVLCSQVGASPEEVITPGNAEKLLVRMEEARAAGRAGAGALIAPIALDETRDVSENETLQQLHTLLQRGNLHGAGYDQDIHYRNLAPADPLAQLTARQAALGLRQAFAAAEAEGTSPFKQRTLRDFSREGGGVQAELEFIQAAKKARESAALDEHLRRAAQMDEASRAAAAEPASAPARVGRLRSLLRGDRTASSQRTASSRAAAPSRPQGLVDTHAYTERVAASAPDASPSAAVASLQDRLFKKQLLDAERAWDASITDFSDPQERAREKMLFRRMIGSVLHSPPEAAVPDAVGPPGPPGERRASEPIGRTRTSTLFSA